MNQHQVVSLYRNASLSIVWKAVAKGNLKFIKRGSKNFNTLITINVSDLINEIKRIVGRGGGRQNHNEDSSIDIEEGSEPDESEMMGQTEDQFPDYLHNKNKLYVILLLGAVVIFKRQLEFYADEVKRLYTSLLLKKKKDLIKDAAAAAAEPAIDAPTPKRGARKVSNVSIDQVPEVPEINFDNNNPLFGDLNFFGYNEDNSNLVPASPRAVPQDYFEFAKPMPRSRQHGRRPAALEKSSFISESDILDKFRDAANRPDENLLIEAELPPLDRAWNRDEGFADGIGHDPDKDLTSFLDEMFRKDGDGLGGLTTHTIGDRTPTLMQSPQAPPPIPPPAERPSFELDSIESNENKLKRRKKGKRRLILDEGTEITHNQETVRYFTNPTKDRDEFYSRLHKKMMEVRVHLVPKPCMFLKGLDFIKNSRRGFNLGKAKESVVQALMDRSMVNQLKMAPINQLREEQDGGASETINKTGDETARSPPNRTAGVTFPDLFESLNPSEIAEPSFNPMMGVEDITTGGANANNANERNGKRKSARRNDENENEGGGPSKKRSKSKPTALSHSVSDIFASSSSEQYSAFSINQNQQPLPVSNLRIERLFTEICPIDTTSRSAAAKTFFKLLKMQKEKKVELVQDSPFGSINIKRL